MKRIGGGFGGKETDNIKFACAAAVAAKHTGCPVRLLLSRDVDMSITGKRHPFQVRLKQNKTKNKQLTYAKNSSITQAYYKVAYGKDGKIQAVKTQLYSNGGAFLDLSGSTADRALFHSENSYYVPNMEYALPPPPPFFLYN